MFGVSGHLQPLERAVTLGVVLPFIDLSADYDKLSTQIKANSKFRQLQCEELILEVLKTVCESNDPMLHNLDNIIFQRIKIPVLCLKNVDPKLVSVNVSGFIELTELRMKIHRLIGSTGPSWTTVMAFVGMLMGLTGAFMSYRNRNE